MSRMLSDPPASAPGTEPDTAHTLALLLSRTALGDRSAFERLYRLTSARLFGLVLRIQPDRAHAEDVLQDTYVNAWRAAASFNPAMSQPMTWLASIARNRAIDSLRRAQAGPAVVSTSVPGRDDGDDDGDLTDHLRHDGPGPLQLLDEAREARDLGRCMEGLSGEQQQSLALAYYQGLSHAEVAEHLGHPLGTVKSWVRRGLQALKGCLERAAMVGA